VSTVPLRTDPATSPKVVTLKPTKRPTEPRLGKIEVRRHWQAWSAVVAVLLPTIIAALYFGLVASDRYVTELRFAVRGQDAKLVDSLGVLSSLGAPAGEVSSDSYILVDYVLSRAVVEELEKDPGIRQLYSEGGIDWFSRFDADDEIEYLVDYWQSMTTATYDSMRGIVSVQVSAFSPEATEAIGRRVLTLADSLVNRLSENARDDALRGAQEDLERAEFRVRMIRGAMRKFRENERIADPVLSAGSKQEHIATLQAQLSKLDAELAAARAFMKDDAPSIIVLKVQREAIESQITKAKAEIDGSGETISGDTAVASMLSDYEEIEAERQFAEKAYVAALASLEKARVEADRKHRYLAVFLDAGKPEYAEFPHRISNTLLVAVCASLLWLIGILTFHSVRDHMI